MLERYFAQYEFALEHMLSASDCESCSVGALYALAGRDPRELLEVKLSYTPPQGTETLRDAIAARTPGLGPDEVVVAAPQELIDLTLGALCTAGTGPVVVLTPCYQSLTDTPAQRGVAVRPWPLRETEHGWALDEDALPSLLDGAQGLVVNFPHNPTGFLPTPEVWTRLLELCQAAGVWLFSDEMYRGLEPDARRLDVAATRYHRAVSLTGLSKAAGLPGLRIGWIATRDTAVRDEVLLRKDYSTICAPAPSEALAAVAMSVLDQLWAGHRARIEHNQARLREVVAAHPGRLTWRARDAGPLVFVRTAGSAEQLCAAIRHQGALLLPSSVFDWGDGHVRFGLGREGFAAGLAAMSRAL